MQPLGQFVENFMLKDGPYEGLVEPPSTWMIFPSSFGFPHFDASRLSSEAPLGRLCGGMSSTDLCISSKEGLSHLWQIQYSPSQPKSHRWSY